MNIEIKHRITGAVLKVIEADSIIGANLRGADLQYANLRGATLQCADLQSAKLQDADFQDADLQGANLRDADLQYANLRGAKLQYADLQDAGLQGAHLRGASLRDADLRDADLRDADLQGADLQYANLRGANLRGANLRGASLCGVKALTAPIVPNLDAAILTAIEAPGNKLDMGSWHTCETTHCRAGWAIHLAGLPGERLEKKIGPSAAGALIYYASTGRVPDFMASNAQAMADIRACAAEQTGAKP